LGLEALQKASEEKLDARAIEIGIVVDGQKFHRLAEDEVLGYVRRLPGAS
jgi:20S proteasome alpha/beta subunit